MGVVERASEMPCAVCADVEGLEGQARILSLLQSGCASHKGHLTRAMCPSGAYYSFQTVCLFVSTD